MSYVSKIHKKFILFIFFLLNVPQINNFLNYKFIFQIINFFRQSQINTSQEHKRWMETLSGKIVGFKTDFDNESKVLAEMVKALAEIQKKEKGKLDQLGKNLDAEMDKLRDTLEEQNKEQQDKGNEEEAEKDANFQERVGQDNLLLAKRVEKLEMVMKFLIPTNC